MTNEIKEIVNMGMTQQSSTEDGVPLLADPVMNRKVRRQSTGESSQPAEHGAQPSEANLRSWGVLILEVESDETSLCQDPHSCEPEEEKEHVCTDKIFRENAA